MLPADFPIKTIQVSAIEVFLALIKWAVMFRILPDRFWFMPRKKKCEIKNCEIKDSAGWILKFFPAPNKKTPSTK